MGTIKNIRKSLEASKARSAWDKGVKVYAIELLDGLEEAIDGGYFDIEDLAAPRILDKQLLNGASDWKEYSWGGCSLISDLDIAERLCNASELKKTDGGRKAPNKNEQWLDTQARALWQAAYLVREIISENI